MASLIIPTRGDRPGPLADLLQAADTARVPTVLVWTGPARSPWGDVTGPRMAGDDFVIVRGAPELNIHKWWNHGLNVGSALWPGPCIVANDDVEIGPDTLHRMAAPILEGAALSYVDPPWAPRITPISGWLFGIDPDQIRPDESFAWWYGEHDLELRARAAGLEVAPVRDTGARHLRTDHAYPADLEPTIRAAVRADQARFETRWSEHTIRRLIP